MKHLVKTELLAPAKDKETALEAINCGADAVYIGPPAFGARKNASNSLEDIKDVVNYAHKFWVKVFVTVNTILTDDEIEKAVKLVIELDKIGVDAILIQDMGLLEKLIQLKLSIPIHASTQCDNRDCEKVSFFKKIGLSRVVLARELSIEQIKNIHKNNPDIELEAFIHGALCVSYSGQCYLSQYIGGRSANKGECAQPCRKKYLVLDNNGKEYNYPYPLCLKDLNASNSIKDMIEAGIYSFKIEGRLKDKGYVKNVVSYYRKKLDKYSEKSSSGKSYTEFEPDLEKSFNRGFTDYFLNGRSDCFSPISPKSRGKYIGTVLKTEKNTIHVKTKYELSPQDGICYINNKKELEGFSINKVEKNKFGFIIYPNKKIEIQEGTKLYRNIDVNFEKELQKPVKRKIGICVEVSSDRIMITDEDNIQVEMAFSMKEKAKNQEKMNETFIKQFSKTGESDFYIINIKINTNIPFMPVSEINDLRRSLFEILMKTRLEKYERLCQKTLSHTEFYKKELDYRANVHNKFAKEFYKKCRSVLLEPSLELSVPKRQIELMRTKHCIKYALGMCKSPVELYLKDNKGKKYSLKFDCSKCEMVVMN